MEGVHHDVLARVAIKRFIADQFTTALNKTPGIVGNRGADHALMIAGAIGARRTTTHQENRIMRTRITAMLFALATIGMGILSGTSSAHAQCVGITVSNFTSCEIGLCLYDAAGNQSCITLGPGGGGHSVGTLPAFAPVGVISSAKNRYPFAGTPFCTPCITIPGAHVVIGCCATVCYDALTCSMTVTPCNAPCLP